MPIFLRRRPSSVCLDSQFHFFLVLGAIQRLPVRSYAMLLFFLPALTYALSAALGYGRFYMSDLLAGGLLLLGVAAHELHMKRLNRIG